MDHQLRVKNVLRSCRQAVCTATAAIRPLPDYLIVGGQRCGTTALHDLLARHPLIGAAHVKEVHFFDLQFDRGERWYRGHFPNDARRALAVRRHGGRVVCGEASPYYLFHPLAPGRVARILPEVRVIAMVRDPVARAVSHYHHEVALGAESLQLQEALAAEQERLAGEEERILADPGYAGFAHQHHSYVARGRYLGQLERWAEHVPAERTLVVRSEDFFEQPQDVVAQVLRFLDLPPMTVPASGTSRNAASYSGIDGASEAWLRERFAEDNRRLEGYLGRELGWR
jgi:hypothetical protein